MGEFFGGGTGKGGTLVTGAGLLGVAKATSIAGIGDSILALGWSAFDLFNGGAPPTSVQINAAYTAPNKQFLMQNFVMHAALRAGGKYFPFEFAGVCSGATSQQIVGQPVGTGIGWQGVSPLDVLLAAPVGRPAMCVVQAGVNDFGNGLTAAQTIAALNFGYTKLASAGIIPIAMTIPPNNNNSPARQSLIKQTNTGIVRLAKNLRIPCADIYRASVNPANGQFGSAAWTTDGTHPTALMTAIWGDVINQAVAGWFTDGPPFFTASYDDAAVATRFRDPNLLNVTGVINATSSYPTVWNPPTSLPMSTVATPTGAPEPGGGHTMDAGCPPILGLQPNYLGNAWTIAGDGAHGTGNMFYNLAPFNIPCAVGDKLALSFRVKWLPRAVAPANVGDFAVCLRTGGGLVVAGVVGPSFNGRNDTCQIGGEPGYDSGYAYFEFIVNAAMLAGPTTLDGSITMGVSNNSLGNSNVGDSLTLANIQVINLTQEGWT